MQAPQLLLHAWQVVSMRHNAFNILQQSSIFRHCIWLLQHACGTLNRTYRVASIACYIDALCVCTSIQYDVGCNSARDTRIS